MGRLFDTITFDCYGTLVDWEGGIWGAFRAAAARAGLTLERHAVLDAYAEIEPLLQAGPYASYREVLSRAARTVAARFDWVVSEEESSFLPDSLGDWLPFPDTNPALRRLRRAGYGLGILSNVDDEMLAATLRRLEVDFDPVVTAQQISSYKPAPAHFITARERLGDRRWLHAAQSWFHDVVPAAGLEVPVAWINRKGEPNPDESRAFRELKSLGELADWLV